MTEFVEKLLVLASIAVFAIAYGVGGAAAGHLPPVRSAIQIQADAPDPVDTDAALTSR